MRSLLDRLSCAVVSAIAIVSATPVLADAFTWTSESGGSWNSPENWDVSAIPTNSDDAILPNFAAVSAGSVLTLDLDGGVARVNSLRFDNDSSRHSYRLVNGTLDAGAGVGFAGASWYAASTNEIACTLTTTQASMQIGHLYSPQLSVSGQVGGSYMIDAQPYGGSAFDLVASANFSGQVITTQNLTSLSEVRFSGQNGAATNLATVQLSGTELVLDNQQAVNSNRIGDSTAVVMRTGRLTMAANSAGSVQETIGTLDLRSGESAMSFLRPGGLTQNASVTFTNLSRNQSDHSTLVLEGIAPEAGPNSVSISNADQWLVGTGGRVEASNRSILPFVFDAAGYITTVDASGVIRPLNSAEHQNYLQASSTDENFLVEYGYDPGYQVPYSRSVNSLEVQRSRLQLGADATLTVNSGVLAFVSNYGMPGIVTGGNLVLVGDEAIVNVGEDVGRVGSALTVAGTTGPLGTLVKSGAGSLALSNSANQFASLVINNGRVISEAQGALGAASSPIVINYRGSDWPDSAPGIRFAANQVIANPIEIRGEQSFGESFSFAAERGAVLAADPGVRVRLNSEISGTGHLWISGGGTFIRGTGSGESLLSMRLAGADFWDGETTQYSSTRIELDGDTNDTIEIYRGGILSGNGRAQVVFGTVYGSGALHGGRISPGDDVDAIGQITLGNMHMYGGSELEFDLAAGGISDRIIIEGGYWSLDSANLLLRLAPDYVPAVGDSFQLISLSEGALTYSTPMLAGMEADGTLLIDGVRYQVDFADGLRIEVVPVPEATSLAMMAIPLSGLLVRRRTKASARN